MTTQPDPWGLPALNGPQPWMAAAECNGLDTEAFFPARGENVRTAKDVCAQCCVRLECLAYAIDNNERYGVWGGRSERERRRMRRLARKAPAA